MLVEQVLRYAAALYKVEREVRNLEPDVRRRTCQEKAVPLMGAFYAWMIAQRELVHERLGITRAWDYSLKRWAALSRYLNDGTVLDTETSAIDCGVHCNRACSNG